MKAGDFCRLLLLAAIWGGSFLFMRVAAPAFGAINTAFLRVLFGFIGLVVILAVMRTPRDYQQKFGSSLLLGVINSGLPFLMYCLAVRAGSRPYLYRVGVYPVFPAHCRHRPAAQHDSDISDPAVRNFMGLSVTQ